MIAWESYQPKPDRFLVFRARQGCGGLGDRVVGLLSACALALLTQRHFRVNWEKPYPLRDVWLPNQPKLPWDLQDALPSKQIARGNGKSLPASRRHVKAISYFELSCIDQVDCMRSWLRHGAAVLDEFPGLIVEGNQCFLGDLLANPCWRPALEMYRITNAVPLCQELLWCLFRPAPALDQALARHVENLKNLPLIGLQIRTLWNWQDGGGAMQQEDFANFFACTQHLLDSGAKGLFVSADDARAIEAVRRRFPDVQTVALPNRILHVDRSEWESFDDYLATFLNIHLLSRCQHLIISFWSNLGRIAALLANQRPWITHKAISSQVAPTVAAPRYRQADLAELLSKEKGTTP